MANNPAQIAARIRELRDILEYSSVDVAAKLNISEQEYLDFENNVKSIPISTLYELADLFNVDFTVLLTGEDPKMGDYTLVRSGQGVDVDRYPGYSFQSLRLTLFSTCSSMSSGRLQKKSIPVFSSNSSMLMA